MYGFCGESGMVSIIPYGMAWYAMQASMSIKRTWERFGSVVERLEALWTLLNAFRAFGERTRALSRLGRLGSIVSISTSMKRIWERLGAFSSVWETF